MFSRVDLPEPILDPLERILEDGDPTHLDALARYYEHRARQLRAAAYHNRAREKRARLAPIFQSQQQWEFMRLGARVVALKRMHDAPTAYKILQERLGHTPEILRAAWRAWTVRKSMLGKRRLRG